MSNDELIYMSAVAMAQAIKAKHVSSEEIIDAYLARIEAVNPQLNAIVQINPNALAQARAADDRLARGDDLGPLHGVPVTIKESFEIEGIVGTGATLGRKGYVGKQNATSVTRLQAAGAIILGNTNTPELSLAFESDNLIYGRTNNPYDLSRTPGGSTGGEAAIIAAGGSPLGLGGDYGGSIRVPAHFCGIAGLRPTVGRVPRTGYFPPMGAVRNLLAQPGPMARYVTDLQLMLSVITGEDGHDHTVVPMSLDDPGQVDLKTLRVACYTDNGLAPATPETVAAIKSAAQALTDAGATVTEARPEGIEQTLDLFLSLNGADGGAGIERLMQMVGTTQVHPAVQGMLGVLKSRALSGGEFLALWFRWDQWRNKMLEFMQSYDVVVCPVCALPAVPHGTSGQNLPAFSYAITYSLTASPAVTVRAGTSPEGLPIGVQIVPRHWREAVGLAVAQQIEKALGGWQRPSI